MINGLNEEYCLNYSENTLNNITPNIYNEDKNSVNDYDYNKIDFDIDLEKKRNVNSNKLFNLINSEKKTDDLINQNSNIDVFNRENFLKNYKKFPNDDFKENNTLVNQSKSSDISERSKDLKVNYTSQYGSIILKNNNIIQEFQTPLEKKFMDSSSKTYLDNESENNCYSEINIKIKIKNRKNILYSIRKYLMIKNLLTNKNFKNKHDLILLNENTKEDSINSESDKDLLNSEKRIYLKDNLFKDKDNSLEKEFNMNDEDFDINNYRSSIKNLQSLYKMINIEFEKLDRKIKKNIENNIKLENEKVIYQSIQDFYDICLIQENLKVNASQINYKSESIKFNKISPNGTMGTIRKSLKSNFLKNSANTLNFGNKEKYELYSGNSNNKFDNFHPKSYFADKNKINLTNQNERAILKFYFYETRDLYKSLLNKALEKKEKKNKNLLLSNDNTLIKDIKLNIPKSDDHIKLNQIQSKIFNKSINTKNITKKYYIPRLEELKSNSCRYFLYKFKNYIFNSSLFILHKDCYLRKLILRIILDKYFDLFIMIIIIFNTILLILDNPWNNPEGVLLKIIKSTNFICTLIFLVESFLKILGFGFLFNHNHFETKKINIRNITNYSNISILSNVNINKNVENSSACLILDKNKNSNILLNNTNNFNINNKNLTSNYRPLNNFNYKQNDNKDEKSLGNLRESHILDSEYQMNIENHTAYLRRMSNCIDLFIAILGLIDIIDDSSLRPAKYLKTIRLIRSFRPIRIFTKNNKLKTILLCLFKSIPAIGNTFIIFGVFIYIYIIIGVGLYKSELSYFCSIEEFLQEEDCMNGGGKWIHNIDNFDNFLNAFQTLFGVMMIQGWVDVANLAYRKTENIFTYFYFITFIIFGYLFVLNLIISVVIEKYKSLKNKNSKLFNLSDEEKEWIKVQKIMLKFRPLPKIDLENSSNFRKLLYKYLISKSFENSISIVILISISLLAIQHNGSSEWFNFVLDIINYCLNFIFNIELIVKIYVFRSIFFYSKWNKIDFIIICLVNSIMIFKILQYIEILPGDNKLNNFAYIFRGFRILRVIRLMTVHSKLRGIIDTLIYLVPSIINIGTIMIIILIIYGCIGVNLFSTLPLRENIHELNNFRDFISAFVLLFKILTGEGWNKIMHEAAYHECIGNYTQLNGWSKDYYCEFYSNTTCNLNDNINYSDLISGNGYSCGSDISYLYFISFMIVGPIFIMNLCIVMVVEGFSESMYENESLLSQEEMDNFISVWINYDTTFKKKVHPHELVLILKQLQPPLGFNYDRFNIIDPKKMIYSLKKIRKNKKMIYLYEKIIQNGKINLDMIKNDEILNDYCNSKSNYFNIESDKSIKGIKKSNVLKNLFTNMLTKNFKNEFDEQFAKINQEKLNPQIRRLLHNVKNGNLKRLKNSYEFENYFFSLNKKFWTTNIEILQIMNFFKFTYYDENKKNKENPDKELSLNRYDYKESFIDDELYVHFVDACLALSGLVVSKKNTISLDMLRKNVVGKYTQKLWKNKYKNDKIDNYFRNNHQMISEELGLRIISKVKGKLMNKLKEARETIDLRKRQEKEELANKNNLLISSTPKHNSPENKVVYDFKNTILKGNELNYYLNTKNSNKFFKLCSNKNENDNLSKKELSDNKPKNIENRRLLLKNSQKKSINSIKQHNNENANKINGKIVSFVLNKAESEKPFIKKETVVYHKIYNKQKTNIEFYEKEEIRLNNFSE